ncbi:hypothetical protein BJ741DRAFT_624801 [Chytriomyces cf. hyalinus JEL632]|nr:hypothetical protein BJ741DRAFT_624801 [Chytriomyces cf. hyalinus JEL632]
MGNKSNKIVAAKGHGQQTHNTQKTILDNPLVYKWPSLDPQDAALILSTLTSVTVNPAAPKRKRVDLEAAEESVANDQHLAQIWKSLAIGVNTVTKCLITRNVANPDRQCLKLSMVFVCKADVAAAHLFAHLPAMCYLAGDDVILVPLPAGSEKALSNCLGLKSVIALGVRTDSPSFQELYELVKKIVGPPRIPWMWRQSKKNASPAAVIAPTDSATAPETVPTIPPITSATAPPIKTNISYHPTNLKTLNVAQGKQCGNGGRGMPAGGASKGKKASKSAANDKK